MLERHPVVAALLEDGLKRVYADSIIGNQMQNKLTFKFGSILTDTTIKLGKLPDVVYLDPMFPNHKKKALVKKEMQLFQILVGFDNDSDELLLPARKIATYRVVVKRPIYAPPLGGIETREYILTKKKKYRFDIYTPK